MARKKFRGRSVNGMLLLNKSTGMTSNDALQRAKRLFFAQKAGHTGSLDPLATGVLPICFGETSKFSQYFQVFHHNFQVFPKYSNIFSFSMIFNDFSNVSCFFMYFMLFMHFMLLLNISMFFSSTLCRFQ